MECSLSYLYIFILAIYGAKVNMLGILRSPSFYSKHCMVNLTGLRAVPFVTKSQAKVSIATLHG